MKPASDIGPLVAATVFLGTPCTDQLLQAGEAIPSPIRGERFLVDTGSSGSFVAARILESLKAKVHDRVRIGGWNSDQIDNVYYVSIMIELTDGSKVTVADLRVVRTIQDGFDGVIGTDAMHLADCVLVYDATERTFSLERKRRLV